MTDALRPWTIDFHVAQNDGTVHGAGSHDKTGKPLPGRRSERQARHRQVRRLLARRTPPSRGIQHICWDGCMFPNAVLETQETWNTILDAMIKVRDAHGWKA